MVLSDGGGAGGGRRPDSASRAREYQALVLRSEALGSTARATDPATVSSRPAPQRTGSPTSYGVDTRVTIRPDVLGGDGGASAQHPTSDGDSFDWNADPRRDARRDAAPGGRGRGRRPGASTSLSF